MFSHFLRKRLGNALGRFTDLLAHEIADRGQVLRQIDLYIAERGADVLGLSDQGVALIA